MRLLLLLICLSVLNISFSQKSDCSWFYELQDNGFDEVTKEVSALSESIYGPQLSITAWPNDPKYKGSYGLGLTWTMHPYPTFIGAEKDIIQMSIKVNGVYKKYTFNTKHSSYKSNAGYNIHQLFVKGGATKELLNDLKIGTELNVVINYGQTYQSSIFKYKMACSSAAISKLLAK
jgi:hypothetical protein